MDHQATVSFQKEEQGKAWEVSLPGQLSAEKQLCTSPRPKRLKRAPGIPQVLEE
jgi:hypothetical protein